MKLKKYTIIGKSIYEIIGYAKPGVGRIIRRVHRKLSDFKVTPETRIIS